MYVVCCKPEIIPFDFQLTSFLSLCGNYSHYSICFPHKQYTPVLYHVSRLSPDGFLKGIQNILLKKILTFYMLLLKLDLVQTALVIINQFYTILCYEFEDLQILFKCWLIHPHKRWATSCLCLQGSYCLCPTTAGCFQPENCSPQAVTLTHPFRREVPAWRPGDAAQGR